MNRPSPLSATRRRAFGSLIRGARQHRGLTYQAAAEAVCARLSDGDGPEWKWIQALESGPARPLSNVVWLDALFEELGVSWGEVLSALGASCNHRRDGA